MSDFRLIEFGLANKNGKAEFALFYVCLIPRTHVLFMMAFFVSQLQFSCTFGVKDFGQSTGGRFFVE